MLLRTFLFLFFCLIILSIIVEPLNFILLETSTNYFNHISFSSFSFSSFLGMLTVWDRRSEFQIIESVQFYFKKIDIIKMPDYLPDKVCKMQLIF